MAEPLKLLPDAVLPEDPLLLLTYRGSIAHGTYEPSSNPHSIDDIDLIGITMGPREHYLGFGRRDTREYKVGEYDAVYYELRKFVNLLVKQNPNVLALLWQDQQIEIHRQGVIGTLFENREMFATRDAYHSFVGYAMSQFSRMTRYVEFNPEREREIQALNSEMMHRNSLTKAHGPGNYARAPYGDWDAKKLRTRYNDLRGVQGYMGEKRKRLVEKFGYDTKNAAHLVRLLTMSIEFLETGEMHVDRTLIDRDELLGIKHGEMPLEYVHRLAIKLFEKAHKTYNSSHLPERVDRNEAERLVIGMISDYYGWH